MWVRTSVTQRPSVLLLLQESVIKHPSITGGRESERCRGLLKTPSILSGLFQHRFVEGLYVLPGSLCAVLVGQVFHQTLKSVLQLFRRNTQAVDISRAFFTP